MSEIALALWEATGSRGKLRALLVAIVAVTMLLVPVDPAQAATTATVCLYDSSGAGIAGAGASYRSGGWQSMGTTGADGCVSTEDPSASGRLRFRISHNGQTGDITQDTRVDPIVVFRTVGVTVRLIDSTGANGVEGATVTYRASGWQTLGTTDPTGTVTGELLGDNTRFRLAYNGQTEDITQDTRNDPIVVFRTVGVTVRLIDSTGANGVEGATVTYRASGWQTLGTTDPTGTVTGELLGDNTRFRLAYNGQTEDITQDTRNDPNIVYQTGRVLQGPGARIIEHRTSGWVPFVDGVQLLAGNIRFRFDDGSTANHDITAGTDNYVPNAPTSPVVTVTDHNGDEGTDLTVTAIFVDLEILQTHSATIDWGDGSAVETVAVTQTDGLGGTLSAGHVYADEGTFSLQICVSDDGNPDAVGCTAAVAAIANVAPVVDILGAPTDIEEGNEVSLTSTVVDPGSGDIMTYLWTVTHDGELVASGADTGLTFIPSSSGAHHVSLTVDDGDGGLTTGEVAFEVTAAPTPEPAPEPSPEPVASEPTPEAAGPSEPVATPAKATPKPADPEPVTVEVEAVPSAIPFEVLNWLFDDFTPALPELSTDITTSEPIAAPIRDPAGRISTATSTERVPQVAEQADPMNWHWFLVGALTVAFAVTAFRSGRRDDSSLEPDVIHLDFEQEVAILLDDTLDFVEKIFAEAATGTAH